MPKTTELRPNKGLRKPNFEKYESSPDSIKICDTEELESNVSHRDLPGGEKPQIGRGLFDFHNHLHVHPADHHAHGLSWFSDEDGTLWRLGDHWPLETKFHNDFQETNTYNCSLAFASLEITAVCYGTDTLFILYDFDKCDKCAESEECNDYDAFQYKNSIAIIEPGILMDARYFENKGLFKIAMCSIADENDNKRTKIVVLTYHLNIQVDIPDDLELLQKQEFLVNGAVDHVYMESSGNFINILSQGRPKITFDSSRPEYCWSQDEKSLTVWLKVPDAYKNAQPSIEITPTEVSIKFNYTIVLQGEWQFCLDSDSVSWSKENDIVKFKLIKAKTGQTWSQLITGIASGEYLPDETSATEVCSRFSYLRINEPQKDGQPTNGFDKQQLDEHDLDGEAKRLRRINLNNYVTTHVATLDANDYLLFTHYNQTEQKMFIKQGHDVCVWSIKESGNDWNIDHQITYPALGDIEASNENKRLMVSPPNCSYIALVERSRYAFVYDKPARKKKVGKMRTVDLGEDAMPTLGAVATDLYLIILTENKVYKVLA